MADAAGTTEQMAEDLEELEAVDPTGVADGDFPAKVDELVTKWRAWIDEALVQADLGRMDVRDEARAAMTRLENAWLALKNEAERTGSDAGGSLADLRRDTTTLLADVGRAARAALERLKTSQP